MQTIKRIFDFLGLFGPALLLFVVVLVVGQLDRPYDLIGLTIVLAVAGYLRRSMFSQGLIGRALRARARPSS